MRKMPVKILMLVWAVGLVLVVFEQRANLRYALDDPPRAQEDVRVLDASEALRQHDSLMAVARTPVTATISGDGGSAVAYTVLEPVALGSPSSLFGILIVAWVFKIPLTLLVFTIAWLIARFLPAKPESPLDGELG